LPRDIERTVRFYVEVLGMEAQTFGEGRKALRFGRQKLNLHQKGHEFQPKAAIRRLAQSTSASLRMRPSRRCRGAFGRAASQSKTDPSIGLALWAPIRSIHVRDPDGNLLEIPIPAIETETGHFPTLAPRGNATVATPVRGPHCSASVQRLSLDAQGRPGSPRALARCQRMRLPDPRSPTWPACLAATLALAWTSSAASADHRPHIDRSEKPRTGVASYYGRGEAGKTTASGAPFAPDRLTAASRTLPLGTKAKVTNRANGKSTDVTVTDRGPYVKKRILDVSPKAAAKLGLKKHGVAPVKVEPLSEPPAAR
jgi:catechol 2,3-dioxygenase-like lactoylglutathione lyase family enzyme